jgi:hypothetical protein
VFWFSVDLCPKNFSLQEEYSETLLKTHIALPIKDSLFLSDFKETRIFRTDFQTSSNIKYYENLSSGSWAVPQRQTDRKKDRQTWLS